MIILVIPWPALIAAGTQIGGSVIGGMNSRRMREYNTPENQIKRLREAGLPLAALDGTANAGNQSATPDTSGITEAGRSIGNYTTTQAAQKNLQILDSQIRMNNAEADLKEAEARWLQSGRGEDTADTNLTAGLAMRQGIEANTLRGGQLANEIAQKVESNTNTRLELENEKISNEIKNLIQSNIKGEKEISGVELDNISKEITNAFKERMSEAELDNLLRRNGILLTQSEIEKIHLDIERATKSNRITMSDMQTLMSELSYDKVGQEFENYNQYYQFVNRVQDGFNNKNRPGGLKGIGYDIQTLINYAYLATVGSGMGRAAAPNVGSILQGMKGAPNQYRNYHIYNND